MLDGAHSNGDPLTLRVPTDGRTSALKTVLARLDDVSVEAEELSVHTPDLNDVFFALTDRSVSR